jgi:thiol-disulfide isomerase/thioredoxin
MIMTKNILGLVMAAAIILVFAANGVTQNGPPQTGSTLPEMDLVKPKDAALLTYLGLSSGGNIFKVNQIKTKVLIIEIFSMYCPYCQAEAPNINKLYQLIEGNPALQGKIKIIGIGAGNTQFEVATFKKKYAIAFPLIPDEDFKLHKIVGETKTPYFIAVKLTGNNSPEVIYSKLGALENIDLFLAQIVKLSGLN